MRTSPPLVAPLFRSEGQAALLAAVLLQDDELGLSELAQRAEVKRSTAYREVSRLVDAGLLRVRTVGREWQISANPTSPLLEPVRRLLFVAHGPGVLLARELDDLTGIETAVIFGSFAARAAGVAGPPPRDIDLLVIGAVDVPDLYAAVQRVSGQVGRRVNPTIVSRDEWEAAVASGNVFARDVLANPVMTILGESRWPSSL